MSGRLVPWLVPFTIAPFALASAALGQCHPGVVAPTPAAGPSHWSKQLLKYDPDGEGPQGPVLVSIGDSWSYGLAGVSFFDPASNTWPVLGQGSMSFDVGTMGAAYGDQAEDCGPNLVVVGTRRWATTPVESPVYLYDGTRWRELAPISASSIQSVTSIDLDGVGPQGRTPAVLAKLTQGELISYQAYVFRAGAWSAFGAPLAAGAETGYPIVPSIVGWDSDGNAGPASESLYVTYRGVDELGASRPMLAKWDGQTWVRQTIDARTIYKTRVLDLDADGSDPARLVFLGAIGQSDAYSGDPMLVFDGSVWTAVPRSVSLLSSEALDATVRSDGTLLLAHVNGAYLSLSRWTPSGWVSALGGLRSNVALPNSTKLDLVSIEQGSQGELDRVFFSPVAASPTDISTIGELVLPTDPHATAFFTLTPGEGFNGSVREALSLGDGGLLVEGGFTSVDGVLAPKIARRDVNGTWHAVGALAWTGVPNSMTQLSDGSLLAIDSGSSESAGYVMRFDGEAWTRFRPTGVDIAAKRILRSDNDVLTFVHLVVGGSPIQANACGLAQWRGGSFVPMDCSFVPTLGLELVALANGDVVRSLTPIAGRDETSTGLMRWDGYEWAAMGEGNQQVTSLRAMPDGTLLGKKLANRISRWDGSQWIADPVDGPLYVNSLTSFDVVGNDDIVAFGSFTNQTGAYTPRHSITTPVARVTGTYWEDPIGVSRNQSSNGWRAVGLQDGSALVLGSMKLNFGSAIYTHFGMFQISACNTCSACIGDWDESGGVDVADVAAFFVDYEQGNRCADVDDSTGVDPVDMAIFFQAYEAGGC